MPQYCFTIRSFEHEYTDERNAVLEDVAAALDYACRMVRDLTGASSFLRLMLKGVISAEQIERARTKPRPGPGPITAP